MGWIALLLAIGSLISALLPAPGMFVAMGLGIAGVGVGWVGFRRRGPGTPRLAGAGAIALAALGLGLALLRYGLTLAAVDRIERLLGQDQHDGRDHGADDRDPQRDAAGERGAVDRPDQLAQLDRAPL
jgi:hypothetical protein